ncbi:hypothetical protein B0H67DRAFT_640572 [Lasiosphaeris hirsuta]|uniref:Uncharacterized protein n=1 Tax=Lasiosphaeris hirsuta TaxID=260670 RepID=A0AA40BDQ1_9PEZI|nr:hypothetical protein B0H67DRAFT_640572 [Lasiosphaeris hirsuta]
MSESPGASALAHLARPVNSLSSSVSPSWYGPYTLPISSHDILVLSLIDDKVNPKDPSAHADTGIPSVLVAAFKDVLSKEHLQPLPTSGNFFIDIACLGDLDGGFLTDIGLSVADAIVALVNEVLGDAAISAHKYCKCFWNYVNALNGINTDGDNIAFDDRIDNNPFMFETKFSMLSTAEPTWMKARKAVPLFPVPDPWPQNGLQNDTPKSDKARIPVLSVAKLGDWAGSIMQFVDALRDIVLNVNKDEKPDTKKDEKSDTEEDEKMDPKKEFRWVLRKINKSLAPTGAKRNGRIWPFVHTLTPPSATNLSYAFTGFFDNLYRLNFENKLPSSHDL